MIENENEKLGNKEFGSNIKYLDVELESEKRMLGGTTNFSHYFIFFR